MDNQMGMFHPDPASLGGMPPGGGGGANGQQQPPGAHHQHPQMQQMQQQQQQQPNHFNSNMSNNQIDQQKHNPVGAWQRGGWDSGIQSGATSQTPSVISGHSDLSAIVSEFSEHMPDFNQTQQPQCSNTAQEASAQMQKMLDYQDEEGLQQSIPLLVQFMNTQDQHVLTQACQVLQMFSKREQAKNIMLQNRDVIPTLAMVLGQTNDTDIARASTGVLHNVSQVKAGRDAIFNCNGLGALIKVLSCNIDAIVFYAITTIHNLLIHIKPAKTHVRDHQGAITQMVALLQKKNNVKFLAICTDCLYLLGIGDNNSKAQMLQADAATQLIHIMNTQQYEKLLWTTSRLMKVLSVNKDTKNALLHAGGFQALGAHLSSPSQRLIGQSLWTMRNLSDAAINMQGLTDVIKMLISKLDSEDVQTISITAGILANLTCNNINNKQDCVAFQGVEKLFHTLLKMPDRQEVCEPVVCSLRHITSRNHNQVDVANVKVREQQGGFSVLIKYLVPQSKTGYPLRKAVIGLLRNLAQDNENRQLLANHDLVNMLTQLIQSILAPIHQHMQANGGAQPDVGRECALTISQSTNLMGLFAKDPNTINRIRSSQTTMNVMLEVLKLRPTQAAAGLFFGQLCQVDKQIVDYMNNLGCLQLIEQINQEEQQKQRIQAEKARQRQWEQQQQMGGWQQQQPPPGHPGFVPPPAPEQQGFHPPPPGHPQAPPPVQPQGFEGYPPQPQMMPPHPHMEGHYPPPQPHPSQEQLHHQQQQAAAAAAAAAAAQQQQQQQQPGAHPHQMPMSNWFEPM